MRLGDTIVAPATAQGPAALALLRVSGRRAVSVADQVFRGRSPVADQASHTVAFGRAVDAAGRELDQVLVTVFRAPRSFTGEDVVEFSCHGGQTAPALVLRALMDAGARLAEPGEFTRRAFLGGKIDLAQAEAVVDLIQSQTRRAEESALARLRGDFSRRIQAAAARAREVLLDCEAFLDFQDQLPEDFPWERRAREAREISADVAALLGGAAAGRRFRDGARVVLAGRTNAGKSSLMNALLDEERALVSEIPGTTRDVLRETVDLGGVPVTLVDTAGLRRTTADPLERAGMERARSELAAADAVVWVVDAAQPLGGEDRELLAGITATRGVVAANKADLDEAWSADEFFEGAAPGWRAGWRFVRTSARTGAGMPELAAALRELLVGDESREPALVGTARQQSALEEASTALAAAAERLETREMLDTAAFELREAIRALDEGLGIGAPEEVLNEIFRRFCIGK